MTNIVKVSEFRKQVARYLAEAKRGSIVLVRHGSPVAVISSPPAAGARRKGTSRT